MRRLIDTCDRCGEAREHDVTAGVSPRPGAAIEPRLYAHFCRELHEANLASGQLYYAVTLDEYPPEANGLRVEDPATGREVLMQMLCGRCWDKRSRALRLAANAC